MLMVFKSFNIHNVNSYFCLIHTDPSITTGSVTYLEPTSLKDNFVRLSLNSIESVSFEVQSSGSDLSVMAYLDNNDTVVSALISSTAASVTLDSAKLPALGTYLLRTEVQPCKGSGRNKDLIIYHEEAITGLNVNLLRCFFFLNKQHFLKNMWIIPSSSFA